MASPNSEIRARERVDSCDADTEQTHDESGTDLKGDEGDTEDMDEDIPHAEEDEHHMGDPMDHGLDSGYDTDPVDSFWKVARWQSRLSQIQSRISRPRSRYNSEDIQSDDTGGEFKVMEPLTRPREMVRRAGDKLKERSKLASDKLRESSKEVVKVVDRAGGRLRESGKEVIKVVDRAGGTLRRRGERLRDGRNRLAGNIQQRRSEMRQKYKRQMSDMRGQLDSVLAKARTAKMRQLRHILCFSCAMLDVVITSFWIGASPKTHHYYYTFKFFGLAGVRAIWYRCQGWHYYLYDLCYYCNLLLLVYIWIFPMHEWLFMACNGFSGVLLLSVPLFRNSFVPHSLDRVTSLTIHYAPALQMWALRWYCQDTHFAIPGQFSVMPAICMYLTWSTGYYTNQFIINRNRIERKGYQTLYKHMAYNMGFLKSLPEPWRTPVRSRIVFILGHMLMFVVGLPVMWLPFWLHALFICGVLTFAFKNGASFYITYFWKVYNDQITAFERQIASAEAADKMIATEIIND